MQPKYSRITKVRLDKRNWPEKELKQAPIWCSVDLRDGNQALKVPMNIEEKMEMFELLVELGFKQIEIGFPASSQTEYFFLRRLIETNKIPEDVTIQIFCQCKDEMIRETFNACDGAKKINFQIYNPTSPVQRDVVLKKSKEELINDAINGTRLVKKYSKLHPDIDVTFQYAPESFTNTEMEFALEICQQVMDEWKPSTTKPMIINLPATVEVDMPNIFADEIEWFSKNIRNRESIILSLHTHNDRGTCVAASELGLLAGAERLEGTLFGNGERSGNLDIITIALNMYSSGIDPNLKLNNIIRVKDIYEKCTKRKVYDRQPYSGKYIFTAFSGGHQDAIKKALDARGNKRDKWDIPYLPIDPLDIGRNYEEIIRINGQSGKSGISFLINSHLGYNLPKEVQQLVGKLVKKSADQSESELGINSIISILENEFGNTSTVKFLKYYQYEIDAVIHYQIEICSNDKTIQFHGNEKTLVDTIKTMIYREFNQNIEILKTNLQFGNVLNWGASIKIRICNEDMWAFGLGDSKVLALLRAIILCFK